MFDEALGVASQTSINLGSSATVERQGRYLLVPEHSVYLQCNFILLIFLLHPCQSYWLVTFCNRWLRLVCYAK